MKVYFAIRQEGYESDTVFGPFAKRRTAADFIENEDDNGGCIPWWLEDWSIAEVEIVEKWEDWQSLTYFGGKPYRPAYCKKQRSLRHEQWCKEHPDQAALEREMIKGAADFFRGHLEPKDILDNLQFGQEIEVKFSKDDIIKIDN